MAPLDNGENYLKNSRLSPKPILDGIEEIRQDFEERIEMGDVKYGIEILDDCVETIRKGSCTLIIAAPNVGKAVSLDCKILTPKGWVKNRDIKVGDQVIGFNGQPTTVLGVFPQGITKTYKVILADKREIICSPEHLWTVQSSHFKPSGDRVYTTEELYKISHTNNYKNKISLPTYSGNHGQDKHLPIHPYLLGVLIGDGCLTMTGLTFCKPSDKVLSKLKTFIKNKITSNKNGDTHYIWDSKQEKKYLKDIGLCVKSYEKFIPQEYIIGTSKEQRKLLLDGLLDTNGYQRKSFNEFSTTSEQLVKDVQQLAWSLGYDCRINRRMGSYRKNGIRKFTRYNYRIIISNQRKKASTIIKDIVPYIEMETQCLAVSAPDSLFIIEDYVVTHNSLWGLTIAANLAKQGKQVLICSCEMGAGLMMERQLKSLCGVSMQELRKMYESSRDVANKIMDEVIVNDTYNYLQNIFISETAGASVYDILDMIKASPDFDYIIVDYLQRIRGQGSDYEVISNASREIQNYARDTKKCFIIASQASRTSNDEAKFGKTVNTERIRGKGSGSIEEDADVGLTLMELEENGTRKILATIFKNRYSNLKNITYKYHLDNRLNIILEDKNA